jgi:IclR family transcriptional regulator, pca regulon regulatory protein
MAETANPRYFINSLERGLSILHSFTSTDHGYSLSELAAVNKISHATANRYMFTLKELGYLIQDPLTKKYQLTAKITAFASSLLRNMDLRSRLMPHMIDIRKKFDVATNCAILNNTDIVYLSRIRSSNFSEIDFTLGSVAPAYCTSLGKAILAFTESATARKIIDETMFVSHTPYTIQTKKQLLDQLALTRKRGYAINDQEMVVGLKSIAVPVFHGAKVEGAFGVTFNVNSERDDAWHSSLIESIIDVGKKTSL